MNEQEERILIQNIIECSADSVRCSAEIDLLISEFIFSDAFGHKSLSDIKNDINNRYNLILEQRQQQRIAVSLFQSVREKLGICKSLYARISDNSLITPSIPSKKLKSGRISYWYTNSYAKAAFENFSRFFESCEEIAAESFSGVCENIQNDETFGVIPIINSGDGRLISFYRMLDKFDLKISAVCRIDNPGSDGFTKFALVGKQLCDIDLKRVKALEITVNKELPEFICLAELLEAEVGEITSIPSPYGVSEFSNYLCIRAEREKLLSFWMYIYLFGRNIDCIGYYSEI